jgi:hypothetical protein
MWIQVDPTHAGESSWVHPDEIERVDVNANPEPPWALITLKSGATCTVSEPKGMKALETLVGTELPKAVFNDDEQW